MEATGASSTRTVRDLPAAAALSDPEQLRFFAPFLGRERTVGEVAREAEATLSTTYRRVRRLCELGLLEVTRELPRAGKPLKAYRSVADAFYLPAEVKRRLDPGFSSLRTYFDRVARRGFEHAYGDQLAFLGERIYRDEDGVFTTMLARAPDEVVDPIEPDFAAALTTSHDAVYLDYADAKRLQRDLHELLQAYLRKPGAQRYLIQLNLLPLPPDLASIR